MLSFTPGFNRVARETPMRNVSTVFDLSQEKTVETVEKINAKGQPPG